MNQTYMKEEKILPLVIRMSLPMIISMAVAALYNIVDSYYVAKMSEEAMTAISILFPIQNFMHAIAVGFGIGMNALIAFNLGANNSVAANKSVTQGMIMAGLHGVILTIFAIAIASPFLNIFVKNEEIIRYGMIYARTVFIFTTFDQLGVAFEKVFQSVGRMKVSMVSMMIGCIINIILDPIMIFGTSFFPALGIKGAALATGIGQVSTLLIYIVFYLSSPFNVKIKKIYIRPEKKYIMDIYKIGIPASLNMALPSVMVACLNHILGNFGEMYIFVLGIYYKLQNFIYLSANGIIQGIRPIVSYNYGAGEKVRVKRIGRTSLGIVIIMMIVGTFICFILAKPLIGIYASQPEDIVYGAKVLQIASIGFVVSAFSVVYSGMLEALGAGTSSFIISLIRYMAVMIPLSFVLSRIIGPTGVYIALIITEFLAAFASILLLRRVFSVLKIDSLKQD